MFIPLTPSLHQDETLKEIELYLFKLEQVVVREYRLLLLSAGKGLDELLRFPAQLATKFQQILSKLQKALEGTGDSLSLRIVTEQQEELRIRMLLLEHLLERDIPYAYLERALNPMVLQAVFAHQGAAAAWHPATAAGEAPEGGGTQPRRWFTGLFRREEPRRVPQKAASGHTKMSGLRGSLRKWFQNLPDYLKSLFLLHHFMEQDELRLLKPSQRVPSLGEEYRIYCGNAVFEATDLGEYHWRIRAERRRMGRPKDEELAKSLQEKLAHRNYVTGTRSHFTSLSNFGLRGGAAEKLHHGPHYGPARTPDELRLKIQHRAAASAARAAQEHSAETKKPTDGALDLAIDYTH